MGAVASAVAVPSAAATSTGSLPPAAQGHPYRHGVVPRRGQAASANSLPASSKNLSFGGGISGVGVNTGPPKVYLVFWGSQWGTQGTNSAGDVTLSGDPAGMAPYLQEFMKGLGTGGETWSGVMTQYCQGISTGAQTCPSSNGQHVGYPTGGALAGVWVDESAASPSASTAHQLAQEAINAAAHFGDYSSSSQYVIVSPTGTSPDGFITSGFCAWHDYTGDSTLDGGGAVASPPGDPPVAFTNLPYITDAGTSCGQNFVNAGSAGTLDGVSIVEGHEYAETITDTFPAGGWTDSSGSENGDKCAWLSSGQGAATDITLTTGKFAVQSTWANDFNSGAGGCEISHPIVTDPAVTVTNPGNQTNTDEAAITPLQMTAHDSNSGVTFTWSATGLPTGVSINSSTGVISGTPTAVTSNQSVTVTVTDSDSASGSAIFTWTVTKRSTSASVACSPAGVNAGDPTTCTATVSDTAAGTAGTPTGLVTLTPTGGCTLGATGTTGVASCHATYTPGAAGPEIVTASYGGDATHSASGSNAFALTVAANVVSLSGPGDQTTTAGVPVSLPSYGSDSGGLPLTYGATGLPAGLTINSSTGMISGTPTTPGTTSVTVTATDSTNAANKATLTWTVAKRSTSTSVSCAPSAIASGTHTTCTATVTDIDGGTASTPSGTVTLDPMGSCLLAPVATGVASCQTSVTASTSGGQMVTAAYGGDGVHAGSDASDFALTVTSPLAPIGSLAATPSCPPATGTLGGRTLGLIRLGMSRAQVRATGSARTRGRYWDSVCSALSVGYASPKLLAGVGRGERRKLRGRVVWVTTTNSHYSAAGLHPGALVARSERALSRGKLFRIGAVRWYVLPGRAATILVEVRGGAVREVGIAQSQVARAAAWLLVRSLS